MQKDRDSIEEESIETRIQFDEQYKYKHLMWMAKILSQYPQDEQQMKIDDLVAAISDFIRYSKALKRKDINSYKMAIDWFKGKINSKEIEAITNELNLIYKSDTFNNYHTNTCVTTWTKTIYPIIDEIENNLYVSV